MHYVPRPTPAAAAEISPEVEALIERLARHNHDVWAAGRLAEGWVHGPRRDDARRQHPGLVPYEELPESEKEFDRATVRETLRALLAAGGSITPPPAVAAPAATDAASLLQRLRMAVDAPDEPVLLAREWRQREPTAPAWTASPEPYRHIAARLLRLGLPSFAADVALAGLEASASGGGRPPWEHDANLRRSLALGLSRSGDPARANRILAGLRAEGDADEETLGGLARTVKDLGLEASTPDRRDQLLREAGSLYEAAWTATGGTWTGINAASLAAICGDGERARSIAAAVALRCREDLAAGGATASPDERLWKLVTLGEAAVIHGELTAAAECYREAFAAAPRNLGDLASARRQARLLLGHLGFSPSVADDWLPRPRVVILLARAMARTMAQTSARPAADGVPAARSAPPEWLEAGLRDCLAEASGLVGFSAAASAADVLFQEAVRDLGGQGVVVLPRDPGEAGPRGEEPPFTEPNPRFAELIARAARVVHASPRGLSSSVAAAAFAERVLVGLALHEARQLDAHVDCIVACDGHADGDANPCPEEIRALDAAGARMRMIRPPPGTHAGSTQPAAAARGGMSGDLETVAMLFADTVNFSGLSDDGIASYVRHYLGPIAELLAGAYADRILHRNTWGDGLHIVFRDVSAAGRCALDIRDLIAARRAAGAWRLVGLPENLDARIGLHAGPVARMFEPVTRSPAFFGTHVSHAARLEPSTGPGRVFASEAFAALAALEDAPGFTCGYVRRLDWAKHCGTYPTYVLLRRPMAD